MDEAILLELTDQEIKRQEWGRISDAVSLEFIVQQIDRFPWIFSVISNRPDLTLEFVDRLRKYVDWPTIMRNPAIPLVMVLMRPIGRQISGRPDLSIEFITLNIRKIDWHAVASTNQSPDLLMEYFQTYEHNPIRWRDIMQNDNLTDEFVDRYFTQLSLGRINAMNLSNKLVKARGRDNFFNIDHDLDGPGNREPRQLYDLLAFRTSEVVESLNHGATIEFMLVAHIEHCDESYGWDLFMEIGEIWPEYADLYPILQQFTYSFGRNPRCTIEDFRKYRFCDISPTAITRQGVWFF